MSGNNFLIGQMVHAGETGQMDGQTDATKHIISLLRGRERETEPPPPSEERPLFQRNTQLTDFLGVFLVSMGH